MGSAKSSTVLPRWAIGLIVGAGVLLLLVAAIIIVRCCNKDGDNEFGNQLKVKPSEPEQTAIPIVEKKPLFERIFISAEVYKGFFFSCVKCGYEAIEKEMKYNITNELLLGDFMKFSEMSRQIFGDGDWDFDLCDIRILCDFCWKVYAFLAEDDGKEIVDALNEFKNFIYANQGNVDQDVAEELKNCVDKINALEPKATDDIQTSK